jgi:hypothetical protein
VGVSLCCQGPQLLISQVGILTRLQQQQQQQQHNIHSIYVSKRNTSRSGWVGKQVWRHKLRGQEYS